MEYLHAMQDARVQYAISTGRIDDTNVKEVIKFLEDTMRKAEQQPRIPEYGYVVVSNMYNTFARKIEHGQEAKQETDLGNVFDLIDQGLLVKYGSDKRRSATFYSPGKASLPFMKKLVAETQRQLDNAISEYERRLKSHQGTFEMKESVSGLTRRVRMQQETLNGLNQ